MDAATRELVQQRAGDRCEYCLLPREVDEWPFHVEHVIAVQHCGGDLLENLCWSCSRCNLRKGTNLSSVDPDSLAIVNLFHPRKQQWNDHFAIVDAHIVGLTPIGRAFARLLQMNDPRRIELRRHLIGRGILPVERHVANDSEDAGT